MSVIDDIYTSLLKGRARPLLEQLGSALNDGMSPDDILSQGLLPAMSELGERFKKNEVFVPEVMRSAQAFNQALGVLKPLMLSDAQSARGTAVIGTVCGDKHDIGKNLVSIMLQGAGLNVIDLGSDVASERFVDAAVENNADIIAMSALLTTTMERQGEVIELLRQRGLRDKIKVMVGGAPITQEFADSIGADAYTSDAGSAAQKAIELIG